MSFTRRVGKMAQKYTRPTELWLISLAPAIMMTYPTEGTPCAQLKGSMQAAVCIFIEVAMSAGRTYDVCRIPALLRRPRLPNAARTRHSAALLLVGAVTIHMHNQQHGSRYLHQISASSK